MDVQTTHVLIGSQDMVVDALKFLEGSVFHTQVMEALMSHRGTICIGGNDFRRGDLARCLRFLLRQSFAYCGCGLYGSALS